MSGADPAPAAALAAIGLDRARAAVARDAVRTPVLSSEELAERAGGPVLLKAECLQHAGSFKLRGALSKLASLEHTGGGLVCASAGNHGRAVAYAARRRGVACTVYMPAEAPVSKVAAVEALGAAVRVGGESVEDALALAEEHAREHGVALVHPFDDLEVIAGQGTLGIELAEEVPRLARVIVPLGGGGLAAGVGAALRAAGGGTELIGVQAQACSPWATALGGGDGPAPAPGATIADGIAIKRPGRLTLPLLRELLNGLETVGEDEIAEAMVFLAEREKLVAEGAGAVAVAAVLAGRLPPVSGATVAVVSGGNVDSGLLGGLLRRRETEQGRRVRVFTTVPDRPGRARRAARGCGQGARQRPQRRARARSRAPPRSRDRRRADARDPRPRALGGAARGARPRRL
jgi:threonine dehydratase